ncbi:hypothetical protein SAMN05443572_10235 [Myxococcus fulvus]|uniref:Lipoprotein n=1 Tax=Myxococcus fulvus TaxID=33 RepID=A0A511TCP6_MYXFU|nr:hypothetical protein [Myxococcus fulvus]GEN10918.1 hypothetical protein MFU01_59550 [Myxococcus fulvus]SET36888.1 hypothetical protein SAMN05443572_10235 [Myxococcus fulvus]
MPLSRQALAACVTLLCVGCVTPYQPMTGSGGYHDMEVAPGVIQIEVRGNPQTHLGTLQGYFHRRAAELCAGREYDWSFDTGSQGGPLLFIGKSSSTSIVVTDSPVNRRHWVKGTIQCRDASRATPEDVALEAAVPLEEEAPPRP